MGVGVRDSALDSNELSLDEIFDKDNRHQSGANMDARRRLEDRIEELRLQRELRDYDFDF